ncbi:MAG: DNA cytosine methyltransferase [Chloroflexi bacterium]|nr:DNA cytosine methyltransferase [Chloroflexota bacterium]
MNSGTVWRGAYLTQNISEHPNVAAESSLSQVIEHSAPLQYFLTNKHLNSLLDRATARNKPLPPEMEHAIQKQISILSNMQQLEENTQPAHNPKDTETMGKLGHLTPEEAEMFSVRRMMPLEYERLQGFPENWTLLDTEP